MIQVMLPMPMSKEHPVGAQDSPSLGSVVLSEQRSKIRCITGTGRPHATETRTNRRVKTINNEPIVCIACGFRNEG